MPTTNEALRAEVAELRMAVKQLTDVAGRQSEILERLAQQGERHNALDDRVDKLEKKLDDVIFPAMSECEKTSTSMKTWVKALSLFFIIAQGFAVIVWSSASEAIRSVHSHETRISVLEDRK